MTKFTTDVQGLFFVRINEGVRAIGLILTKVVDKHCKVFEIWNAKDRTLSPPKRYSEDHLKQCYFFDTHKEASLAFYEILEEEGLPKEALIHDMPETIH